MYVGWEHAILAKSLGTLSQKHCKVAHSPCTRYAMLIWSSLHTQNHCRRFQHFLGGGGGGGQWPKQCDIKRATDLRKAFFTNVQFCACFCRVSQGLLARIVVCWSLLQPNFPCSTTPEMDSIVPSTQGVHCTWLVQCQKYIRTSYVLLTMYISLPPDLSHRQLGTPWPVRGVQIVGKGAKNRATAQRTASVETRENGRTGAPLSPVSPRFFTRFPNSRLSPLSERLEQARPPVV